MLGSNEVAQSACWRKRLRPPHGHAGTSHLVLKLNVGLRWQLVGGPLRNEMSTRPFDPVALVSLMNYWRFLAGLLTPMILNLIWMMLPSIGDAQKTVNFLTGYHF